MALLTPSQYAALYGSLGTTFPDNTTAQISEGDMRQFGQDQTDSLLFKSDIVGTSGTPVPYVFCGNANLSTDLFPTTGGTGSSGAIKKGNSFRVSVGTTASGISGTIIDPNSEIIALVDTPGQTLTNWWIRI